MDFLRLFLGACTAMLATALGAAGVMVFRRIDSRLYALIISFCAGMMVFSALEMITKSHALAGHRIASNGFLVGLVVLGVLDKALPHAHLALRKSKMSAEKKKVALLVGTITLHNIPEGFAIASAFADSPSLGWLVTVSIALQDIPEGLMVAAPVACYGVATRRSFLWGVFSGLAEFAAAIAGFLLLRAVSAVTPFALGFSGGAMSYVIFFELLPDVARSQNRHEVVAAFIAGIAIAYGFGALIGF